MHLTKQNIVNNKNPIYSYLIQRKEQVIIMGFVLLGLFVIVEIALLIVTFVKQKEKVQWIRNRVVARVGEMVLFAFTLLLPGVAWDLRFKMCFGVLLIRVVIAVIFYVLKNKKASGCKSKVGTILGTAGSILVLALSLIPSFLFTGYKGLETTGTYQVKEVSAILVDQSRTETFETDGSKREVPVHIYYPDIENAGENSFPLVIFSHGAFGYYQSNVSTYMELVSNGYVVISLDHPYHSFFTEDTAGNLITVNPNFLQEVMMTNEDSTTEEEILKMSQKWIEIRTADINYVLNSVEMAKTEGCNSDVWFIKAEETEKEIKKVLSMVDMDTIGLMGHSLGGAASVTVGREREGIDAVIDLDGTMLGEELGFENGEYQFYEESYPVPLLAIDNEEHYQLSSEAGKLYVNTVVLENAVDSKRTYFAGSGHMNFTDLPLFSPILASLLGTGTIDETECIETMNGIVLTYFNCYLKGDGEVTIQESY